MNCKYQDKCGACGLAGTGYAEQFTHKRDYVAGIFRSAGLDVRVNDVIGMDSPFNYRNKVIANVSMKSGRICCGMYEENSHRVVDTPDCMLQNICLNAVLKDICTVLDTLHIRAHGFGGVLKQILLRIGVNSGQVLVVFVTSDDMFHGRADLVKRLVAMHPEIRSVVQNTNRRDTSVVLGERETVLYGSGWIVDELMGMKFKISARSFYQVNPVQTEKLYSKALELARIGKDDTVMDAYCGIGTISLCAASAAGRVIGVEINRDAVRDAIGNARHNKAGNVCFCCDDVKRFMREFDEKVDILILDPPRSGCDPEFLAAVKRLRARRIVYISCNPLTQARDVRSLSSLYRPGEAWPVDMFPHTPHVENILVLDMISK